MTAEPSYTDEEIMEHLPDYLRSLFLALPKDTKLELATKYIPALKGTKIIESLSLGQLEDELYLKPKTRSSYLHKRSSKDGVGEELDNSPVSGNVLPRKLVLRRKKRRHKDFISIEYRKDNEEQTTCKECDRKLLNHTTVMEHTKTGQLICTKCFDDL